MTPSFTLGVALIMNAAKSKSNKDTKRPAMPSDIVTQPRAQKSTSKPWQGTAGHENAQSAQEQSNKFRVVGYCRTSGEGQRDNTSIPRQQQTIKDFAALNGWIFLTHYGDECKSGAKEDGREAFQQMMRDAALGKFDLIVPFDVSRFARDGVDILGNAKFLRQNFGIHVVDTKGHFDSRTRGNTLLNFVHAGVSEYERIKIMERMIGGRIARAKAGKP